MTEIFVSSITTLSIDADPILKIMDILSAKKPLMEGVRISTVPIPTTKSNNFTIQAGTRANSAKNTTIQGKMRLIRMIPNPSNLYALTDSFAHLLMLTHNYQSS